MGVTSELLKKVRLNLDEGLRPVVIDCPPIYGWVLSFAKTFEVEFQIIPLNLEALSSGTLALRRYLLIPIESPQFRSLLRVTTALLRRGVANCRSKYYRSRRSASCPKSFEKSCQAPSLQVVMAVSGIPPRVSHGDFVLRYLENKNLPCESLSFTSFRVNARF
jgi:hypothetical protein